MLIGADSKLYHVTFDIGKYATIGPRLLILVMNVTLRSWARPTQRDIVLNNENKLNHIVSHMLREWREWLKLKVNLRNMCIYL